MNNDDQQFAPLLNKAKSGDQDALLELVVSNQSTLGNFVQKNLGDQWSKLVSEDDILQETFIQALKSISRFNGDNKVGFVAWLKAIANNRIRDVARKATAAKRGGDAKQVESRKNEFETRAFDLISELSGDGFTPSYFAARQEAVNALQAALVVLPDEQREAIQLNCFEKLSLEETAQKMNRSKDSVRGLLQRGKQALRKCMKTSSQWFTRH